MGRWHGSPLHPLRDSTHIPLVRTESWSLECPRSGARGRMRILGSTRRQPPRRQECELAGCPPVTHWSWSPAASVRTPEGLSWPVRPGRVSFILGLKAPIPQEVQFRTQSGNVTPQCWTEICRGLGSQALWGSQGWVGRRHWGSQGCGALATCPTQSCPESPRRPLCVLGG